MSDNDTAKERPSLSFIKERSDAERISKRSNAMQWKMYFIMFSIA